MRFIIWRARHRAKVISRYRKGDITATVTPKGTIFLTFEVGTYRNGKRIY